MYLELQEIAKQKQQLQELNKKMKARAEKFGSQFRELTLQDFQRIKLQKARQTGDEAYLKDLKVLEQIADPVQRQRLIHQRTRKFFTPIQVKDAQKFFEHKLIPDFSDQNVQLRQNALHLYGVDYMSNDAIRAYFTANYTYRIEWLNDSSCNLVFQSKEIAGQLVEEFTRKDGPDKDMKDQSEEMWWEFRPYTVDGVERRLFARVATNKDVKNANVKGKNSKYYEYVMSKLQLKRFVQNKAREVLNKTKRINKKQGRHIKIEKKEEDESSSSDAQSSSGQQPQKQTTQQPQ